MKPYVICHMCTTIDGRILGNRWGKFSGQREGTNLFEITQDTFGIDAWIVGTTTMKEFAAKPSIPKPVSHKIKRVDFVGEPKAKKFAIGIDTKGVLTWKTNHVDQEHVVLLITQRVSDAYLAHLQEAGVTYFFCGKTEVNLAIALDKLAKTFKLKKLLLEGGGKANGSFLAAGLVDEISQVIIPIADGGVGISTMFDIPGDAPKKAAAHLKFVSRKLLPGGVNWLRYKVVPAPK